MGCWGLQAWQGDENTFMWRLASGGKTDRPLRQSMCGTTGALQ